MQKRIAERLRGVRDKGCTLFVILLVTLPLWVMSVAMRGPGFAVGALLVLLLLLFALGWLNKRLDGD